MSSKDTEEMRVVQSKNINVEIMIGNINEIINELSESLLFRYQIGLTAVDHILILLNG